MNLKIFRFVTRRRSSNVIQNSIFNLVFASRRFNTTMAVGPASPVGVTSASDLLQRESLVIGRRLELGSVFLGYEQVS